MAKVQAYVSDEIVYKINKIVERRRAEGAKSTDVSFSSISTMLLELGLRVYEAQMERKESAFNQAEFNKVLLECAVKTQSTVAKILGIESLSLMFPGIQSLNTRIWSKISGIRCHLRWRGSFQKMMRNKKELKVDLLQITGF